MSPIFDEEPEFLRQWIWNGFVNRQFALGFELVPILDAGEQIGFAG